MCPAGLVAYTTSIGGSMKAPTSTHVAVLDHDYKVVVQADGASGVLNVDKARLWWPYSLNQQDFGYMYHLQVGRHLATYSRDNN